MTRTSRISASNTNAFGRLGEKQVDLILSNYIEVGGEEIFLFEANFMGEKAQLLDFLVRLIDEENPSRARAEYFFAQIKTIHSDDSVYPDPKVSPTPTSIEIEFTQNDVYQAQCMQVPVYVFAVDARDRRNIKVYVAGINSFRRTGIYNVKTTYELNCEDTRLKLRNEVIASFAAKPKIKFSSVFDCAKEKKESKNAA